MIELLFVCLIIWMFYAWKTGKFSKENQEKNRAEFRKDWLKLKQDFKKAFTNSKSIEEDKLKLQAKKDYEYSLKLLGKSKPANSIPHSSTNYGHLPNIQYYRYVLEYKDSNGKITIRGVDITTVHKGYQNTRWYFNADTDDGERTFKSQRVIRLKDQWTNTVYETAEEIRKHLLSEHPIHQVKIDE